MKRSSPPTWQHCFSLVRHQYGKEASLEVIMDRMLPGVPSEYTAFVGCAGADN